MRISCKQCQMLVENTLKLAKRLAQFQFNWVNREIRALKEDISLGGSFHFVLLVLVIRIFSVEKKMGKGGS